MLARPKMEYASSVWDPHKNDLKSELEKVQRRAARIVTNRHRNTSSVGEMLESLEWQTLERRRRDARLLLLYKILEGEFFIDCPELKLAVSRPRRTKAVHSRQLERCICNKEYRLNAFLPRTIRDWNSLPEQVVSTTCADSFRQKLLELV